jgi:DNA-binding NarL/FixJ family response regulator
MIYSSVSRSLLKARIPPILFKLKESMIRLLVADDHPIVREGLKHIIEKAPDIMVADEASNGPEVLSKVSRNYYDMILLDISMPGRSGLEVLKQLNSKYPDLPVLILSIYPEKEYALRALKTGASGYLTKKSASKELVTAIKKVSAGKKYISSSLATILATYLGYDAERQPHEILSNREYQVMRMISSGKTLTDIANELSLNLRTISTYRTRILEKMKMESNAELVRYAFQKHLID